jgi:hypothetical protein
VRPQARNFLVERRVNLHDQLHGEVHGCLEHGQLCLHHSTKAGISASYELRMSTNDLRHFERKKAQDVSYCDNMSGMGRMTS